MALRTRLTEKVGRVYTKVWNRLEGSATELKLLKVSTTLNAFETLATLTDSWFFEYSEFRQNFLLEIGQNNAGLTADIEEATHVEVDDEIYVIRRGDTTPPKGTDVTWKLFCDKFIDRAQFAAIY